MNRMKLEIDALSVNEAFARSTVSAFCVTLNPTLEELNDIKTAVSEAVTNCVVHAYESRGMGIIEITAVLQDKSVEISIEDHGKGIENIEEAMQPFYTTKPEQERSGMGFMLMQTFMDELKVSSQAGKGTKVYMKKTFQSKENSNAGA